MNGELAQLVSLVAHGNAALLGSTSIEGMEATHSTFRFVRSVRFEVLGRWRMEWRDSPGGWVDAIRGRFDRLSIVTGSGAPSPFVNSGAWAMVGHGRRTGLWRGRWEVPDDPPGDDGRIWQVEYPVERVDHLDVPTVDLGRRATSLADAIGDAIEFARDQRFTPFDSVLESALALGSADAPAAPYHDDMLPTEGYGPEARRLLAMASAAWVFGGMGSWNDAFFEDPAVAASHQHATARLHDEVVAAVAAAANAYEVA